MTRRQCSIAPVPLPCPFHAPVRLEMIDEQEEDMCWASRNRGRRQRPTKVLREENVVLALVNADSRQHDVERHKRHGEVFEYAPARIRCAHFGDGEVWGLR